MGKQNLSFFLMNFFVFLIAISFIVIVFDLQGYLFVFELGILLMLMFLAALAMIAIYNSKNWGWNLVGATLIAILIDIFFIFFISRTFKSAHLIVIISSVLGLLLVLFNLGKGLKDNEIAALSENIKDNIYHPSSEKIEKMEEAQKESSIEKTFTPGKFIASKKANKFHSPKCDWASRITKENQIWFDSKEEAEKQGFEADKCVP